MAFFSAAKTFWPGRTVVITGASSGIGESLAWEVAARGAKVGLIARREELLRCCVESLTAQQHLAAFAVADVTDADAMKSAIEQIAAQLGPIDVAIANAGVYRKTPGSSLDAKVVRDVFATNVNGVANLFAAVLPGMIARRRGNLAAVSSIAGFLGLPGAAAYSASKAAVMKFCDSLRVDLHAHNIRVTTICPGFVDTPMITDEERRTLKRLVSAKAAAAKICSAIERGAAECSFPQSMRFEAIFASCLPAGLYRRVMAWFGEMDEAEPRPENGP